MYFLEKAFCFRVRGLKGRMVGRQVPVEGLLTCNERDARTVVYEAVQSVAVDKFRELWYPDGPNWLNSNRAI
jgi:hypothetical protein